MSKAAFAAVTVTAALCCVLSFFCFIALRPTPKAGGKPYGSDKSSGKAEKLGHFSFVSDLWQDYVIIAKITAIVTFVNLALMVVNTTILDF